MRWPTEERRRGARLKLVLLARILANALMVLVLALELLGEPQAAEAVRRLCGS